ACWSSLLRSSIFAKRRCCNKKRRMQIKSASVFSTKKKMLISFSERQSQRLPELRQQLQRRQSPQRRFQGLVCSHRLVPRQFPQEPARWFPPRSAHLQQEHSCQVRTS